MQPVAFYKIAFVRIIGPLWGGAVPGTWHLGQPVDRGFQQVASASAVLNRSSVVQYSKLDVVDPEAVSMCQMMPEGGKTLFGQKSRIFRKFLSLLKSFCTINNQLYL